VRASKWVFVAVLLLGALTLAIPVADAQASGPGVADDDEADGAGQPGVVEAGVLFLGHGEVAGELGLVEATRAAGGDVGGECFSFSYIVSASVDPVSGALVSNYFTDSCYYEVFCFFHRVDDIDEPSGVLDQYTLALFSIGETTGFGNFLSWRHEEPEEESVVLLDYCVASESGALNPAMLAGVQPWGVAYTPGWMFVPIRDEVTDPAADAQELWSLLAEPPIEVGSFPPIDEKTIVQAHTWVWLEDGTEPPWAVAMSPAQTAALMVRARAVDTVWEFGDLDEDATVECGMDQLVRYEPGVHELMSPGDANACAYQYRHTCFVKPFGSRLPGPQCENAEGFEMTVSITFEGEQALMTRPSVSDPWPVPVWEPFAASREVTSEVFSVAVVEILAVNG